MIFLKKVKLNNKIFILKLFLKIFLFVAYYLFVCLIIFFIFNLLFRIRWYKCSNSNVSIINLSNFTYQNYTHAIFTISNYCFIEYIITEETNYYTCTNLYRDRNTEYTKLDTVLNEVPIAVPEVCDNNEAVNAQLIHVLSMNHEQSIESSTLPLINSTSLQLSVNEDVPILDSKSGTDTIVNETHLHVHLPTNAYIPPISIQDDLDSPSCMPTSISTCSSFCPSSSSSSPPYSNLNDIAQLPVFESDSSNLNPIQLFHINASLRRANKLAVRVLEDVEHDIDVIVTMSRYLNWNRAYSRHINQQ